MKLFAIALLCVSSIFAQAPNSGGPGRFAAAAAAGEPTPINPNPAVPPTGYEFVVINGLPTTVPSISTQLNAWIQQVENQSIISLTNEGLGSAVKIATEVTNLVKVLCAESNGTLGGCNILDTITTPYVAEIESTFALVPASQWDPRTFTTNPCGTAACYKPKQPAPIVAPVNQPLVGPCYPTFFGTVCSYNTSATAAGVKDGDVVTQDGVNYVAHISQGLMGPTRIFVKQ